jgi:hypothetical protein
VGGLGCKRVCKKMVVVCEGLGMEVLDIDLFQYTSAISDGKLRIDIIYTIIIISFYEIINNLYNR